ncbi:hypothetical protein ACFYXH_40905 [Streptomyces sp. NPDC002730]|uniref:hypothetical protein n=1 Tax=Streptomyces sp. NPDC002730 TaxID=3364662 RepID=UPI0036A1923B
MELRAQEQRLVQIRRRATLLAVALVSEPFSAATDERLRTYVANDADEAQTLARTLLELPQEVLRSRISELSSRRGGSGVAGEGTSDMCIADMARIVAEAGERRVLLLDPQGKHAGNARAALRGREATS